MSKNKSKMKDLINKYLHNHYALNLSTYVTYKLYDKISKKNVSVDELIITVTRIFGIDVKELKIIFDEWIDKQETDIKNKIVDIRYELFKKAGIEITVTIKDLNNIINTGNYDILIFTELSDVQIGPIE